MSTGSGRMARHAFYLPHFFAGNVLSFFDRGGVLYFFSRKSREMSFCLRVTFCPAINIDTIFYSIHILPEETCNVSKQSFTHPRPAPCRI